MTTTDTQSTTTTTTTTSLAAVQSPKDSSILSAQVLLAKDLEKEMDIPMIPKPIVSYLMAQVVEKLATALSADSIKRLQELQRTRTTRSKMDDLPVSELEALADQMATELASKVDTPMLDDATELLVLQQMLRVLVKRLGSTDENDKERAVLLAATGLRTSRDLLQDGSSREGLVKKLAAGIDIPLLDKDQEIQLVRVAVDACASTLEKVLPPGLLEALQGESQETIDKMKLYTVENVNRLLDIPGLSDEQQREILESLVNIVVDYYLGGVDSDGNAVNKSPKEQLRLLREKRDRIALEEELCERRYAREKVNLRLERKRIKQSIRETKRKMGFFRRFFA